MTDERADARITGVLSALEIPTSSWYRKPIPEAERRRPGPKPRAISEEIVQAVLSMATGNPWYGYQRIAVMCRREDDPVKDRQSSAVVTIVAGLTGRWFRKRAAIRWFRKRFTRAVGRSGFPDGRVGLAVRRRSSTRCWLPKRRKEKRNGEQLGGLRIGFF